jgi:hypothetical protein
MTIIINLFGGPGTGKSLLSAYVFLKMKIEKFNIEYIQEYVKTLVWMKEFDQLNNQYQISYEQYKRLKCVDGAVDFVVTDGSLLHGLYHNRHNKENNSNIEKTEKQIMKWFDEFDNINIYLKRGNYDYQVQGRTETKEQAIEIDEKMLKIIEEKGVKFTKVESDLVNIDVIMSIIKEETKKIIDGKK